jgi:hypothetical protein
LRACKKLRFLLWRAKARALIIFCVVALAAKNVFVNFFEAVFVFPLQKVGRFWFPGALRG